MCQLGIFNTNPMHMLYKVTVMAHTSGSVTHSKKPDFTCFYLLAAMKGTFGYHEHNERITGSYKTTLQIVQTWNCMSSPKGMPHHLTKARKVHPPPLVVLTRGGGCKVPVDTVTGLAN